MTTTRRRSASHSIPAMTPVIQDTLRRYVDGATAQQIADERGLTLVAVREEIKRGRAWLVQNGNHDVRNVILLRRALRAEGLLDGIELL